MAAAPEPPSRPEGPVGKNDADEPGRPAKSGIRAILKAGIAVLGPGGRRRLVLLCALTALASSLEVAVLYLVARLSVSLSSAGDSVGIGLSPILVTSVSYQTLVAIATALLVVLVVATIPMGSITAKLSSGSLKTSRTRILRAYLDSSWPARSNDPEGHLQQLVGLYAENSERLVHSVATILISILGAGALILGATFISPGVAFAATVGMAVVGLLLSPLSRRVQRSISSYQGSNLRLSSLIAQTARVAPDILVFDVADQAVDEMGQHAGQSVANLRKARFAQRITPLLYMYGALALILILILALARTGAVGAIAPVLLLLVRALGYLKQLQTAVQLGTEYEPYATYLQNEVERLHASPAPNGELEIDTLEQIRLEGLTFEYTPGRPVLFGVDLTISAGEALGVIGPSGAGKSTLSQLLLRLRTPTSGRTTVNGLDLADITAESWANTVAHVPQSNELIFGTVADNIRFFRGGFSDEEVHRAARGAHLEQEILALPEGFDTAIGPGAQDLSGGQRQRLGFARALLGRPQLLVLDEPTSALDPRSESLLRKTLTEIRGSTTLVVIAHRRETLEVCDRLVRIQNGKIEEVSADAVAISDDILSIDDGLSQVVDRDLREV